jgi:hypothetical protein
MARYIDDVVTLVSARQGLTCREMCLALHAEGRHDEAVGLSAALTKAYRVGRVVRDGKPYRYSLPPVKAPTADRALDWKPSLPDGALSLRDMPTDRDRLWQVLELLCTMCGVEAPERPAAR